MIKKKADMSLKIHERFYMPTQKEVEYEGKGI